jgi:hypothetical protein
MHRLKLIRLPLGAALALALAAPALAYEEKDAIRDCEDRIRSEYGLSDVRDAHATQVPDSDKHYQVQGKAKVEGDKYPWTCEVKDRHVVRAEYTGPKPEGMNTAQKLAIGAAAVVAAGIAASALSEKKEEAPVQTTEPSGGQRYANRCQFFQGKHMTGEQPCSYSQHQGAVYIDIADGTSYALSPVGSHAGTYVNDRTQDKVYRKSGLGSEGVIYQFPSETIHILY